MWMHWMKGGRDGWVDRWMERGREGGVERRDGWMDERRDGGRDVQGWRGGCTG